MPPTTEITRRRLLASAGVGAAAVGLGGGGFLAGRQLAEAGEEGTGAVAFYGEHQAGIDTAAQDRLHFAAFDLLSEDPAELRELLRAWTVAASEASAGEMVGSVNEVPLAPPEDTGETVGLLPSRLTVTFGFGPSLFEKPGLGLAAKRPAALRPLPPLPGDELSPAESGGDICVQACSPPRARTAAPASSGAVTRSPTASTRASASSKPGSSSSASSATPASSPRSSSGSARWTRSTSTSSTSAAPSSRCPPAPNPAATSASACSPDVSELDPRMRWESSDTP